MRDYLPLDISKFCNAGAEVYNPGLTLPIGRQSFHGIPFQVGPKKRSTRSKTFILFAGKSRRLTIPINQRARCVIVAHRLLQSELLQGGDVGKEVAEYVFRMAGGLDVCVPIRERFEISDSLGFGLSPFLALPDQKHQLPPRYEGLWSEAGRRQTEVIASPTHNYYLWSWTNPEPDRLLESLEVVPLRPRFIIAGITLGYLNEYPFTREGRRPAKITLTHTLDARKSFSLDVQVDRGYATDVQPIPQKTAREFINDSFKGWGEALNQNSSPAYVEIAAVPSANVTVSQSKQVIGQVNWGDVEKKGKATTPSVSIELLEHGKNWVHVTVLDEDTGRLVPCRVHFRSPEGIPYQPHGHHNHVNSNLGTWHVDVGGDVRLGQITYAYIDGACQGWLPLGQVIVDIARGFEYEPLRAMVDIKPGQRQLVLKIKRWTNMNARRWFSGDSHVHFLSTQGAHLESQAEDLNVVNLLQSQWGSLFTNTEDFTGRPSVSQDGDNIVYVSQENRQHILGHMILWGLKKHVMPWCSDGPTEAELAGTMETNMSWWADQCHAQGGTVVIPHFPNPNGEPATLIATGRVDAVEMIRHQKYNHLEYYRYLNCGYRLPLVGGTDKMTSEVPVGLYRTYVFIPEGEEFNYDSWCHNVAKGRTFLSGGPIIHFSVEGHTVGDTVQLSGPGTVEIEARAESILPIHSLEIVQEGRIVASTVNRRGTRRLELKTKMKVTKPCWLAARCGGPNYYDSTPHHDVWNRGVFAHTSPIYIACGGEWWMFDEHVAHYMLTQINGGLAYIRNTAALNTRETITHHHGETDHLAFLQRAYHEAQENVFARLRRRR